MQVFFIIYIFVRETVTITGELIDVVASLTSRGNESIVFKNHAPFVNCIM